MIHANSHAVGWVSLRWAPMHRWKPRSLLSFRLHVPQPCTARPRGSNQGKDGNCTWILIKRMSSFEFARQLIRNILCFPVHCKHRSRRTGRVRSTYARRAQNKHRPTSAPPRHKGSLAAQHEGFCANFLPFRIRGARAKRCYAKFATGMTEVAEDVSWSSNLHTASVWTMWAAITEVGAGE